MKYKVYYQRTTTFIGYIFDRLVKTILEPMIRFLNVARLP